MEEFTLADAVREAAVREGVPVTQVNPVTKKKNPDYSSSAVSLYNNPKLGDMLAALHALQESDRVQQNLADSYIPEEVKESLKNSQRMIAGVQAAIREAIEQLGSYQDVEAGCYAVKQRRESVIYQPALVRRTLPETYANMVIVESVDSKKMEGMIKGGFVTQEQAKQCGEGKQTFVYIIR